MSDKINIVQLVSGRPGGVYDYAVAVEHLLAGRFVAMTTTPVGSSDGAFKRRSFEYMRSEFGDASLLIVHCSIYEYGERGLCGWLPTALEEFRLQFPNTPMIMVFHETYAFGPPWRSAFWLSPIQKATIARLARLATRVVTNTDYHARIIGALTAGRVPIEILPVPSNIGEPLTIPPLCERDPVAIVFGGAGTRQRLYDQFQRFRPRLAKVGIRQMLDIGMGLVSFEHQGSAWSTLGAVTTEVASAAMLRARYGLINYPAFSMPKSGVAAAYFAYGLVLVNISRDLNSTDGLSVGENFMSIWSEPPSASEQANIAARGHQWYSTHRVSAHVNLYLRLIRDCLSGEARAERNSPREVRNELVRIPKTTIDE